MEALTPTPSTGTAASASRRGGRVPEPPRALPPMNPTIEVERNQMTLRTTVATPTSIHGMAGRLLLTVATAPILTACGYLAPDPDDLLAGRATERWPEFPERMWSEFSEPADPWPTSKQDCEPVRSPPVGRYLISGGQILASGWRLRKDHFASRWKRQTLASPLTGSTEAMGDSVVATSKHGWNPYAIPRMRARSRSAASWMMPSVCSVGSVPPARRCAHAVGSVLRLPELDEHIPWPPAADVLCLPRFWHSPPVRPIDSPHGLIFLRESTYHRALL
jgi:hypothetical protein